jgi:hypothetical protein
MEGPVDKSILERLLSGKEGLLWNHGKKIYNTLNLPFWVTFAKCLAVYACMGNIDMLF